MPHPSVTILLPVLNEEGFIDACLGSLADQDYPGDLEVIVADGGSTDATLDRIDAWKEKLAGLRVVQNPRRRQSYGLNLAAEEARGEILVRADAHTTYAIDYVRRSVDALRETGASAVGGSQHAAGRSPFGRAVAAAMGTPLATGPARFRHTSKRTEADTVYLGAFRKSDWRRLGGWRTFPTGVAEDADLYYRWRKSGAVVVIDPEIRSTYSPRDTIGGLWRQYYRYGMGKADMLYVNGELPSWRPTAPLLLIVGLTAAVVGLIWTWWPLVGLTALWLGSLAVATRGRPLVMVAGALMHLAYGAGMVRGLLRRPGAVRRGVR
ncbi:MAG TPA: glycosyltransferase family 2 protein [Acidimicrobiia bacterium]|nr:glycosyltransferase family 2 protein [Acidimicrobiia bacterium]